MKPRSIWKGHLKLELITLPVRMYTALNDAEKVSFNQLHKNCHQRLRQELVCPVHGKIERSDIVKGYEIEPDRYVVIDPIELDAIKLESTRCIELVQFIPAADLLDVTREGSSAMSAVSRLAYRDRRGWKDRLVRRRAGFNPPGRIGRRSGFAFIRVCPPDTPNIPPTRQLTESPPTGQASYDAHAANFRSPRSSPAADVANRARPVAHVRNASICSAIVNDPRDRCNKRPDMYLHLLMKDPLLPAGHLLLVNPYGCVKMSAW